MCYLVRPKAILLESNVSMLRLGALHLWSGRRSFIFFEIHPASTMSTNSRITICSYYK